MLTPVFSPLIALLISSAIGTSISAMASERILKPLNQLVTATKRISTGDFSVRVAEINDNSEIANLLRGFNHMAEELSGIEMFRNNFINDFHMNSRHQLVQYADLQGNCRMRTFHRKTNRVHGYYHQGVGTVNQHGIQYSAT